MSGLHFVAGEFRRLVSTARNVAGAVRQIRPDRGISASASTMSDAELTSLMQSVEEKCVGTYTVLGWNSDDHADSLDAADRDFIVTEKDNGRLISSIIQGPDFGGIGE